LSILPAIMPPMFLIGIDVRREVSRHLVLALLGLTLVSTMLYGAWRVMTMARWIATTPAVCAKVPDYSQLAAVASGLPRIAFYAEGSQRDASAPRRGHGLPLFCAQYALAPAVVRAAGRLDPSLVAVLVDIGDMERREKVIAGLTAGIHAAGRRAFVERSTAGPVLVWGRDS